MDDEEIESKSQDIFPEDARMQTAYMLGWLGSDVHQHRVRTMELEYLVTEKKKQLKFLESETNDNS